MCASFIENVIQALLLSMKRVIFWKFCNKVWNKESICKMKNKELQIMATLV